MPMHAMISVLKLVTHDMNTKKTNEDIETSETSETSENAETFIPSKDASLESSIRTLQGKLAALGIHVEEKSWLNEVEGIWSVHVINRDCTRLFTNGKGASQLAARASAYR